MHTGKITKTAGCYLEIAGSSYTCQQCAFFRPKADCLLFPPNEKVNGPSGGCNYWVPQPTKAVVVPEIRTLNKSTLGYSENLHGFTCGRCLHFSPRRRMCERVSGSIAAGGCCNLWQRDQQRGSLTDAELKAHLASPRHTLVQIAHS